MNQKILHDSVFRKLLQTALLVIQHEAELIKQRSI